MLRCICPGTELDWMCSTLPQAGHTVCHLIPQEQEIAFAEFCTDEFGTVSWKTKMLHTRLKKD